MCPDRLIHLGGARRLMQTHCLYLWHNIEILNIDSHQRAAPFHLTQEPQAPRTRRRTYVEDGGTGPSLAAFGGAAPAAQAIQKPKFSYDLFKLVYRTGRITLFFCTQCPVIGTFIASHSDPFCSPALFAKVPSARALGAQNFGELLRGKMPLQ